ncbi:yadK domain protein [Escherichia coli DEC2E]|nr:yadK domain protein [Escherichia coli DEC2E]
MRPTQRNLMKKSILLLSLLFSTTFPVVAGQDVDIVANIKITPTKVASATTEILI